MRVADEQSSRRPALHLTVEADECGLAFSFPCMVCSSTVRHLSPPSELQSLALSEVHVLNCRSQCASCGTELKIRVQARADYGADGDDCTRETYNSTAGNFAVPAALLLPFRNGGTVCSPDQAPKLAQVAALAQQTDEEALEEIELIRREVSARLEEEQTAEQPIAQARCDDEDTAEQPDSQARRDEEQTAEQPNE